MKTRQATRWLALAVLAVHTSAWAQIPAESDAQTAQVSANDICFVDVGRLVFTLADLTMQSCMASTSGKVDIRCSSLCWCRSWASEPAKADTLVLCVPMNATSTCVNTDCREALEAAAANATSITTSTPSSLNSDDDREPSEDKPSSTSGWVYVIIGVVVTGIVGGIAFAVNWYRNRPVSIDVPATVTQGQHPRQAAPPTWTELDVYDDKMPEARMSTRPSHRRSIPSNAGPMHIDTNASIISGVSGVSYHDLDGTRLGHIDAAHALTETELSLCKDATVDRVFSPVGDETMSDTLSNQSSFMSTDSVDIIPIRHFQTDGRTLSQRAFSPIGPTLASNTQAQLADHDSSFISVASTTYMTNNDTFSSQITMLESETESVAPSSSSASRLRETEF